MTLDNKDLLPGNYIICIEALWNTCAKDPYSDYQAFCIKLLSEIEIKLNETKIDPIRYLKNAMASRA